MIDGGVDYGYIEESNIYWRRRETEDYVIVVSWPSTFTTSMGGQGWPETGENTTTSFAVYVEIVTDLDMRKDR